MDSLHSKEFSFAIQVLNHRDNLVSGISLGGGGGGRGHFQDLSQGGGGGGRKRNPRNEVVIVKSNGEFLRVEAMMFKALN